MRAGPAPRRARGEAGTADEVEPGEVHVVVTQPGASGGDEERRVTRTRAELVTAAGIGGERVDGAGVERHLPRLAELGLADVQHSVFKIDVVAVEVERLADAQPAHHEQADKGLEGGGAQRRGQLSGGGQQGGDVGVGIQIGHRSMRPGRQQPGWRHLMDGVEGVEITSEGPHHREPISPPLGTAVRRQARPREGVVGCDDLRADGVEVAEVVGEEQLGAGELEAHRPADDEVASSSARRSLMTRSPATAGPGRAGGPGRPWRRWRCSTRWRGAGPGPPL